ncbi:MAG: BamA/TamA family outer membrane protein, partial [Panacibacter sp.]
DTADISLLQITLDPFEQAQKIAAATEKRKQNPTCIVIIKKRENTDTLPGITDTIYFKRYLVGNIYYYPETARYGLYGDPDSLMSNTASFLKYRQNFFTVFYKKNLFKFQPLREHTYQRKGVMYNEDNFYKTLNNFNQSGAWERVDYRTVVRNDSVDFHYFLTPAKKQTLSFNLETSRNTGDFLSSGNLIGLALNTTYINRNVWHKAIQSATTLSNGVEFSFIQNSSLLQTIQTSLSHIYSFPRLIIPSGLRKILIKNTNKLDGLKTQLNLSAGYSERKDFFRVRSFVAGWGYEWRKKNVIWQYKPLNIELYSLDKLPLLDTAILENPFLKTSFNTGSIISQQLSFNKTYPDKRNNKSTNFVRVALEESGGILGRIKSLQNDIYQYIKLEAEYRKLINYRKSAMAFRIFGGIGYNYGNAAKFGNTLPFYKQFVGGGPNSMRAWGLRLLGLGSSIASDTASSFRDRYGDMQLEANAEYRFTLAQFSSVKIGGALFTDMGNVWNVHKGQDTTGSNFSFNRLGKNIAIGVGTGIRFDFSYFLIRIDLGIKLKDPARRENNGWLNPADFTWKNYEYSVKNPDTGKFEPPTRNNYAIQLGIGLPF